MDDTVDPDANDPSPTPRPRRRGLTSPLPAVVVGLGLASTPAAGQVQVVARPDFYTVAAGTQALLPVLANDTLDNALPTTFYGVSGPGIVNVLPFVGIVFMAPAAYSGTLSLNYCIRSHSFNNSCTTVQLLVAEPAAPVPALGGVALAGLSGVLGWLGMRLRRRA